MKMRGLAAISLAALLATTACAPAVHWREPMTPAEAAASADGGTNTLAFAQRRLTLPDGWSFGRKKDADAKTILFWIRDTGGNSVTGTVVFEHVDVVAGGPVAAERLALFSMKGMTDIEAQRTEIDNTEAYIVQSLNEPKRMRRISTWILGHPTVGTDLTGIHLFGDKTYVEQNQSLLYGIPGSFRVVPRGLSERKIKGAFSFSCDDGAFTWLDDDTGRWRQKGYVVAGRAGDGILFIGIKQVTTTRFVDFIKTELFNPREFETVLHFAGETFPARAIHRNDPDKKIMSTVLLFKRGGKDYMLDVLRTYKTYPDTDEPTMHDSPAIRPALDTHFHFVD